MLQAGAALEAAAAAAAAAADNENTRQQQLSSSNLSPCDDVTWSERAVQSLHLGL